MGKLDKQELIWELAALLLLSTLLWKQQPQPKNLLFVYSSSTKSKAWVERKSVDISILIASNFKIRVYIMEDWEQRLSFPKTN